MTTIREQPLQTGNNLYRQGTTSTETDVATVYCIRDGLLPGAYEGQLTIKADNTEKTIHIKMIVPPLRGDYEGLARIDLVNGKPADLANVDLFLSLYVDEDNVNGLPIIKGVLNSAKTILFPIDFALLGCNYLYQSNQFVFKGGYRLPPSDIDNPPFNISPAPDDIDWNKNGKFDRLNPFPFELQREITLVGDRVTDIMLEGEYYDVIKNVLPTPIYLQGTFSLSRIGLKPSKFTPMRYTSDLTYNDIGDECECGSCGGGIEIGDNNGTECIDTLIIDDPVTIDESNVRVKICHLRASDLEVEIISPSSTNVMLHQRSDGENIDTIYDTYTPTVGNLDDLKGESAKGPWTIKIRDLVTDVSGQLVTWSLELQKSQITGVVVDGRTGAPISGALVVLNGTVIVQSYKTSSSGIYIFNELPSGTYTLNVSRLGYEEKTVELWIYKGDINVPDQIPLIPITVEQADFMAAPTYGQEPLKVEFVTFPPSNISTPEYTWDFGDGSSQQTSGSNIVEHTYLYIENASTPTNSGVYSVMLTIKDLNNPVTSVTVTKENLITVIPTPNSTMTNPCYIYQYSFSGGGNDTQEYAADMASFDIDRHPLNNFPGEEDMDYPPANGRYDEYTIPEGEEPTQFRIITNIGATISGTSLIGDKVIHMGVLGE